MCFSFSVVCDRLITNESKSDDLDLQGLARERWRGTGPRPTVRGGFPVARGPVPRARWMTRTILRPGGLLRIWVGGTSLSRYGGHRDPRSLLPECIEIRRAYRHFPFFDLLRMPVPRRWATYETHSFLYRPKRHPTQQMTPHQESENRHR